MTVASTTSKSGPYNGNGSTSNFAVLFKYTDKADVDVIVASSAGVETTKTLNTHYTLTDPGDTGTVSFITTPTDYRPQTGETVTIVRTMPMTQSTDYTAGGGFSSATVEATDDRQLMQIQEIAERVSRSPKLRQTTSSTTPTFPEPLADHLIAWNSAGTDLENKVPADLDIGLVSAFIQTLLDDVDAATARTTLDAQQADAGLTDIAGLAVTDGNIIVGDGTNWVAESGATARTSLGLGTANSPTFTNETLTGYLDLTEIATPASPAANVARTYAHDVSGRTELAYMNSSGQVTDLLRGLISPKDYGAVGDGTTDDTTAITAVDAIVAAKYVPSGVYDTTLAASALDGPYWGRGQIRDTGNNLRAPWFSAIKAAPSSFGDQDAITTAYDGDLSKVQIAMEHRITGAATLGNPTTGYSFYPEASAVFARMFNSSGHNEELGSNVGRTMSQLFNLRVDNAGQGDCSCIYAFATVQGTKASSTHFLANPASTIIAAQSDGFTDGVYLNPYEIAMNDNGFDVAGIGWVVNMNRTVATGAKTACWIGYRSQSTGSADVNSHFSAAGPCDVGLDFTSINTDASLAAVALLANDRIYGNASTSNGFYATSLGDDFIEFNSGINAWSFANGNVSQFQIYSNQVVTVPLALFQSNVVVNHTAALAIGPSVTPLIQALSTNVNGLGTARFSNGATGTSIVLAKSRGATIGTNTVVQANDTIGLLRFSGADGTGFIDAAYIEARVTGTPGTNDMPGSLIFFTTPDGSATPVEAYRVTHTRLPIWSPSTTTPETLGTNGQFTLTPTSNTNMRISYRGSDGTTRVADITLA